MSDPVTRLNAALKGRYRIERELFRPAGLGIVATVPFTALLGRTAQMQVEASTSGEIGNRLSPGDRLHFF